MKARRPSLLAGLGCISALAIVRFYAAWTCNGQQPYGIRPFEPEGGAPISEFGCIEGYTTAIGVILNALTVALPICAAFFLFVALTRGER